MRELTTIETHLRSRLREDSELADGILAELVAARRPTVTSALSKLSRIGLVRSVPEGWRLSGPQATRTRSNRAWWHVSCRSGIMTG